MRKLILATTLISLSLPALQGCVPAVATGVGAGALMIVDRRPGETYLADEAIEIRSLNRINEKFGDKVHVNVTSYNMKVLLTGEVPDAGIKADLEKAIAGVTNVKGITNEVQIAGISSFSARSNDTYITSKVKARFIDANKFQVNHVKVVTEAGTVYLLGLVTRKEGDDAAEIARTTAGVKKVVRVFEYIEFKDAQRLDNRPPEDARGKPAEGK
ncbi:MAG: BON domain-containing protein [Rhodocyclaceae bacterium]|nr:BON domain-containing protein [Rhodocyclaceae bacterium]MBZ0132003.1 BON domain-containing protein [Rhodocyclaceae bacterium]MCO5097477.1 BON domain-containing protein [Rhodocyclaceae bacterium]MCP5298055.1 BON domain-containing protein [Zoogloeaceae bacterium]PKO68338.1 MAG: transporter [Betaproteobacteria bacterium HGW-Betaproteobacteria-14]